MGIRILGDVEISSGEHTHRLGAGKVAALAVALTLQRGMRVGPDRLMDCLWSDPPRSAVANLRTYASRLRRALGTAGLHERAGGYVLLVDAADCDHLEFRRRTRMGRSALRGDDPALAAARFEQALRLWRHDRAADGVTRNGPLSGWLAALDDERHRAAEDLAESRLHLGQEVVALDELRQLLAVAPGRGRAWRLRMIAHHRLHEPAAVDAAYQEAALAFRMHLDVDVDPVLTTLRATLLRGASGRSKTVLPGTARR